MSLIGLLTATEKQVVSGRLHMRPLQWHLKRCWHVPESLEKVIPLPRSPCPPKVVVGSQQGSEGSAVTPVTTRPQTVHRCLKRRLGRTLRRLHRKRSLVQVRRRLAHKFARTQGGPFGLKTVRAILLEPDCLSVHGQHDSGLVHQQGRGYEIRLSLCPPLETPSLVQPKGDCATSLTHPGSPECHCRQTVPTQTGDSDRMVSHSGDIRSHLPEVAHTGSRFVCDQVQSQTSQICISSSGQVSLAGRCVEPPVGGRLCLPSDSSARTGGLQAPGPRMSPTHSDCARVAKHAVVLGPGQHVGSNSSLPSQGEEFVNPTVQSMSTQGPIQPEPSCVAPRATTIQQAGFSGEVAARIESPQRRSTRADYESKWAVFLRWSKENKVEFRSPSIRQIADFLLFLFQEKHLQPSTIDGYRTAIADKIGNDPVNISKDENLTRLLDSFHRDKPKGRRGIPSWNLSLVLHQPTKPPFEPLRKASLKHLTFKMVFLLALGSGKRRSEIHAWVHKNIRHQEDWSNVSLYPSPGFISKNHLAKEGPGCVAPVIIPALAPTLDKSLKEDRILCPVRALRYYLDKTKELRTGKELVLSLLVRVFRRTLSLLPSPPGLSGPLSYAINCLMNRLKPCTKSGHMMSVPLRLPKPFKVACL